MRIPVTIDAPYLTTVREINIDQTIEIEGNKLTIEKVALYPTQSRIYYRVHEDNPGMISDVPFYLKDGNGERVKGSADGGLSGMGLPDSDTRVAIRGSRYFEPDEELYLCLDSVGMCPDAKPVVTFDPETGRFSELPDFMTAEVDKVGGEYHIITHALYPDDGKAGVASPALRSWHDADGEMLYPNRGSSSRMLDEGGTRSDDYYTIEAGTKGPITATVEGWPAVELDDKISIKLQ